MIPSLSLLLALLVSGCGPGKLFGPTLTPTSTETPTPTNTFTSTLTYTPTLTLTPTNTLTPTITLTPTLTFTATKAHNLPGTYALSSSCKLIKLPSLEITIDMCVFSVIIQENGNMQFNIAWTPHLDKSDFQYVIKYSDEGNRNMYVTDDLGNRYDYIGLSGAAGIDAKVRDRETIVGSYIFPPSKGGTAFRFYDADQNLSFGPFEFIH
jgi:hypothetical protein